jgi:hypothetical protein
MTLAKLYYTFCSIVQSRQSSNEEHYFGCAYKPPVE